MLFQIVLLQTFIEAIFSELYLNILKSVTVLHLLLKMAAESWLEDELAELDEAEQFIQQTMSEFVPSRHISGMTSYMCIYLMWLILL